MFITFEGIDRSGKSTQAALLADALGPNAILLREPGGTEAGERVRAILKDPGIELDPTSELMLFCAARAQLVAEVIRPALAAGKTVICDRFTDSTVAYQGHARGLGAETARELCDLATAGLAPDLTVLVEVDPARAAARAEVEADRFEDAGIEFQEAVAAGYAAIAAAEPGRIARIDGDGPPEEVHREVLAAVRRATPVPEELPR